MPSGTLVIFDCDGVLVDSEVIASEVFSHAVKRLGLTMTAEEADSEFRGRSLPDCLAILERRLGREVPNGFLSELREATKTAFGAQLQPVPHVREVLLALRQAQVPMCVASSGSLQKVIHSLQLTSLLEFFHDNTRPGDGEPGGLGPSASACTRLFSAEQVRQGKPAPDLFLFAARHMGYSAARCLVIEDSRAGVLAALAAQMDVLAFVPPQAQQGQLEFFVSLGIPIFCTMRELLSQLALRNIRTHGDGILPGEGPC